MNDLCRQGKAKSVLTATLKEGVNEHGFLNRSVGFSEGAEEILALAADCNYLGLWGFDGVRERIRYRAIYLHTVLADRS